MKYQFYLCGFLATGLGSIVSGCGSDGDSAELVESTAEPITGGTLVTSNNVPYSSVVHLTNVGCTATKVGDRRFLTAAHCVPNLFAGGALGVTNALDGSSGTVFLTIASVATHPSYDNVILYPNSDPNVEGHMAYDVAVIDVTADTPQIPQSPINSLVFSDNFQSDTVGYGCDTANPSNAGQKQHTTFVAMPFAAFQAAAPQTAEHALDVYAHQVAFDGRTNGRAACPGDSGGPSFRNTNHAIAGVTVQILGGISYVERTANVRRWIAQPQKNVFQDGSGGFLLNALSAKCIGSGDPNAPRNPNAPDVVLGSMQICNAPQQESDLQFWTLHATATPGYFSIVNGNTGNCLSSFFSQGSTDLCRNGDTTQSWTFIRLTTPALPGYYWLQNQTGSACLEVAGQNNGADFFVRPCVDKLAQRWIFTE